MSEPSTEQSAPESARIYDRIFVGTNDLDRSLFLWAEMLGLELQYKPQVPPPGLCRLWGLPANAIRRHAVLITPGAPGGRLHLVEFRDAVESVRQGAKSTDVCPKNLDFNVLDIDARIEELVAAGYQMRSAPMEHHVDGLVVKEVQLPVEDDINMVLMEVVGEPLQVTPRQFGGATSVVTTVADIDAEIAFFETLGFQALDRHCLQGETIEKVIGLPSGGKLHMQLLGDPAHRFGRVELVSYEGIDGANLYPRALPPVRGMFRAGLSVDDVHTIAESCRQSGYQVTPVASYVLEDGEREVTTITSPAGWKLDVMGPARP